MASNEKTLQITVDKFYQGYSPLAFQNDLTSWGSAGNASLMTNADVINGEYVTQGPGLANLTNGTQAGVVTELIQFIMDKAVADDETYAIGTSQLFKVTSTTVTSAQSISGCTEGESIQVLKGNLFYFYNKTSSGEIGKFDLASTFTDSWGSTVPSGAAALEVAPHPSDKKEDIIVFGNGRYTGTYIAESDTLTPQKLDFGNDAVVDDVLFNAGYWYLVVNSGITGTNRTSGQIYLWDGSTVPSTLSDETGVGMQRIGFLYRVNGIIYVAYQDLTSTGFIIGFIQGKAITPLVRYTGDLPTFQQKTLFKNTLLFLSSGLVYSAGALVSELPYQLSQYADGGHGTIGAIAAPFGTPMISSTDGSTNFRLAQFSGFDVSSTWKSIVFSVSKGRLKAYIDSVVVLTKTLGAGASCALTIEADQADSTSDTLTITTTGKRRHVFNNVGLGNIEDFRVALDFSGGSTSNDCAIREVVINYHLVES